MEKDGARGIGRCGRGGGRGGVGGDDLWEVVVRHCCLWRVCSEKSTKVFQAGRGCGKLFVALSFNKSRLETSPKRNRVQQWSRLNLDRVFVSAPFTCRLVARSIFFSFLEGQRRVLEKRRMSLRMVSERRKREERG